MSETSIRAANAADVPAIARVNRDSWMAAHEHLIAPTAPDKLAAITDESWDATWRDRLSADTTAASTLVAEQSGEIVGIAFWQPSAEDDLDPSRVAELKVLYVTTSTWRSGIGRLLVEAALEGMRRSRFDEAVVWVLEGNNRAVRFYDRTGWTREQRVDDLNDWGTPALRYRRNL